MIWSVRLTSPCVSNTEEVKKEDKRGRGTFKIWDLSIGLSSDQSWWWLIGILIETKCIQILLTNWNMRCLICNLWGELWFVVLNIRVVNTFVFLFKSQNKEKTHMVHIKEWEKADLSIYLSFKIKSRLCINGRSPDSHFHSVIWEQGRPWVHWLTANKKLSTGIRWVTRARPGEPLVQSTVHCTLCTQGFKAEHGTWCRIMTWS